MAVIGGTAVLGGMVSGLALFGIAFALAWSGLHSRVVCAWLERCTIADAMRSNRDRRDDALDRAAIARHGLVSATLLVDQIMVSDPTVARYIDLEGLLDRYVDLELAIARCSDLHVDPGATPTGTSSATRLRIREHGLALQRDAEARLASARDELASIPELLRLVLDRSDLAKLDVVMLDTPDDPVATCIALLED
ncbi:MAG: hypothetical protein ABI467_01765 [Kofleriaceae bacterium]